MDNQFLILISSSAIVMMSMELFSYTYIMYVCICVHRVITGPYFVEVFGLPDHPMLADVNAVLKHSSGEKYIHICIGIRLCV